jgi:hypothetical protein
MAIFLLNRDVLRVFFFDSFQGKNRVVEIPELIQTTTQGRLVRKPPDEERIAVILRQNGEITKRMDERRYWGAFDPDAVRVPGLRLLLIHHCDLIDLKKE